MPDRAARAETAEWRSGWPIVLAAGFGLGLTSLYFYSLGLLVPRLREAFGWSPAEITLGPLIISAVNLVAASRVGKLVDRLGVRRVALPGYVAFCLALAALGLAGPHLLTWYALWALLACTFIFTAPSIWSTSIVVAFERSRGLALSIALCSLGLTAMATPLIEVWAIHTGGWRLAYAVLGLSMLVLGAPVLLFALPRGPAAVAASPQAESGQAAVAGLDFAQALRSRRFWMLAAASLLIGAGVGAMVIYLPSVGESHGLTTLEVAGAASLTGLAAIAGRLLSGVLLDRLPVRLVGAAFFLLPALACAILTEARDVTALGAVAVLLGLASGGDFNVLAMLTGRYFGMRNYAAIYGQIAAAFNIGVGLGPPLAGAAREAVGGYGPVLVGLMVVFGLTATVTGLLGREPA